VLLSIKRSNLCFFWIFSYEKLYNLIMYRKTCIFASGANWPHFSSELNYSDQRI
jgi:hypothetical protein